MKIVIKEKLTSFFRYLFMKICYITRPRGVTIAYFKSFKGQYSDNPRAISEKLHVMAPDIIQVWVLEDDSIPYAPDYVKVIPAHSYKSIKAMAQARIWVLNTCYSKVSGIYKPRTTYYVQTWHGDRGVKKIGYLAADSMGDNYQNIHTLPFMDECNLYLAGSDFGVKNMRMGLHYNGDYICEGCPRNDKLVKSCQYNIQKKEIRKKIGVDSTKKIILYAPTFRDKWKEEQNCDVDTDRMIECLNSQGEEWICLIRAHSSSKGIKVKRNRKFVIDVSKYPDMADLLLITDILVTDYSSCATDFVLTEKPVILALFDKERYQQENRSLLTNPEEVGFLCANNQDELDDILSKIEDYDHHFIATKINHYYGTHETGSATQMAVSYILNNIS